MKNRMERERGNKAKSPSKKLNVLFLRALEKFISGRNEIYR